MKAATRGRILVVDDDEATLDTLKHALESFGCAPHLCGDGYEALRLLERDSFPVILLDYAMPGLSGLDVLKEIRSRRPEISVVLVTAHGSIESAVDAMKLGAFDYLTKPFLLSDLNLVVRNALERARLHDRVEALSELLHDGFARVDFICESPAMKRLLELTKKAAAANSSVLIQGESGTGKEVLAKALHRMGPRRDEPFVAVNCAALPEGLMESELFGCVKGAFTGAIRDRAGYFEAADKGTLFLDEITDMPHSVQVKLLRALQEKEVHRIGDPRPISINVRVVAASNRSLTRAMEEGAFREDLYYRVNVVELNVPPLRDRKDDILPLAEHFLTRHAARNGLKVPYRLAEKTINILREYLYPGNVRELENAIERAATVTLGPEIDPEDLPETFLEDIADQRRKTGNLTFKEVKKRATDDIEKSLIIKELSNHKGSVTDAAKVLGMGRTALQRLLKKHSIHSGDFKM